MQRLSTTLLGKLGKWVSSCPPVRQCQPLAVRTMTSDTGLSLQYEGNMAVIKMEKEDNRLNQDFFNIFHDFLDQVEGNGAIKGLITTGRGKFYSNGLDLAWMQSLPAEEMLVFMRAFLHFTKRLLLFPVPTLAALNGHTFAGGAVMAYAQDFRVMNAEKGWICLNEVHLDKRVFDFLTVFLRLKLGSGLNINDALVFGRRYTAQEAIANKLVHSEAPLSSLLEHSVKLLGSYMGKDGFKRETLRNMKLDVYKDCLSVFNKHINDVEFAKQFMTESQIAQLGR